MELILIWIGFAVVTGIAANSKGRSFGGWLIIGALTGVFGLIAVLVMPKISDSVSANGSPQRHIDAPATYDRPAYANAALIKTYKGVQILRGSDGTITAFEKSYPSVIEAEQDIDRAVSKIGHL